MRDAEDALQVLPKENLPELHELYKGPTQYNIVCNFLTCLIKWSKICPENVVILVPRTWSENGSFVVVLQFHCYQLFPCTLEQDCDTIYNALKETEKIAWPKVRLNFLVLEHLVPSILKLLKEKETIVETKHLLDIWWLPPEKALHLDIECPPDVYIDKLPSSSASLINSLWPHKFPDSEKYLATFIEMNGGLGVYLHDTNELVAWGLRYHFGMGAVQTADKYKRRGYGTLITKALSREFALDGCVPLGTVLKKNTPSQKMFINLGFTTQSFATMVEMKVDD